jgi:hypothetical protein
MIGTFQEPMTIFKDFPGLENEIAIFFMDFQGSVQSLSAFDPISILCYAPPHIYLYADTLVKSVYNAQ